MLLADSRTAGKQTWTPALPSSGRACGPDGTSIPVKRAKPGSAASFHEKVTTMIHVRPFEPADAGALAPRLRAADLRELEAATGERPLDALERCTRSSDPCFSVVDGQVIAVFGVVPDGPERGIVWMVGSDEIASRAVPFARIMRPWVGRLQERYRILWNVADARNVVHLRWLALVRVHHPPHPRSVRRRAAAVLRVLAGPPRRGLNDRARFSFAIEPRASASGPHPRASASGRGASPVLRVPLLTRGDRVPLLTRGVPRVVQNRAR